MWCYIKHLLQFHLFNCRYHIFHYIYRFEFFIIYLNNYWRHFDNILNNIHFYLWRERAWNKDIWMQKKSMNYTYKVDVLTLRFSVADRQQHDQINHFVSSNSTFRIVIFRKWQAEAWWSNRSFLKSFSWILNQSVLSTERIVTLRKCLRFHKYLSFVHILIWHSALIIHSSSSQFEFQIFWQTFCQFCFVIHCIIYTSWTWLTHYSKISWSIWTSIQIKTIWALLKTSNLKTLTSKAQTSSRLNIFFCSIFKTKTLRLRDWNKRTRLNEHKFRRFFKRIEKFFVFEVFEITIVKKLSNWSKRWQNLRWRTMTLWSIQMTKNTFIYSHNLIVDQVSFRQQLHSMSLKLSVFSTLFTWSILK